MNLPSPRGRSELIRGVAARRRAFARLLTAPCGWTRLDCGARSDSSTALERVKVGALGFCALALVSCGEPRAEVAAPTPTELPAEVPAELPAEVPTTGETPSEPEPTIAAEVADPASPPPEAPVDGPAEDPPDPVQALLAMAGDVSTSIGGPNDGRVEGAVALPDSGPGFRSNPRRPNATARFGTVEMVQALVHAARVVQEAVPGSELVVNDLGLPQGGPVARHGSHRAGRDVDVLFYLVDREGQPVPSVGAFLDPRGRGYDFQDLADPRDDVGCGSTCGARGGSCRPCSRAPSATTCSASSWPSTSARPSPSGATG